MNIVNIETVEQQDIRLGRQLVHDERSRAFVVPRGAIDRSAWRDKSVRIYDPSTNPNQCHGECTGCAKMMQFNALGNRRSGRGSVLGMSSAHRNYARNTQIDPWAGQMVLDEATGKLIGEDTGSSGLASCKSAVEHGLGGEYLWEFGGADGVIENVMAGRVMSVGTWWYADMFGPSGGTFAGLPIVTPTGGRAGGHQYVIRGYDADHDRALGRCWWGSFRDFWISRTNLDSLLRDGGDAHFQKRA